MRDQAVPLPAARPSRVLTWAGYAGFLLIGWNAVVLPSIIRSVEAGFHQGDAQYGLLYLAKALLYAAGAFGGGFITERLGRRGVLTTGLVVPALALVLAAASPTWLLFVLANALVSWGGGVVDGGFNALFLDLYRDARGAALNLLHLFFGAGALIGPFLIGLLVSAGMSWRIIVLLTGVGFASLIPVMLFSPMPGGRTARGGEQAVLATERSMLPFVALAAAIAFYTGAEIGVGSWVVRLLSSVPLATATAVLSIFWLGLSLGRLLSRFIAERFHYSTFTIMSVLLASASLIAAVLTPWLPAAAVLYGLAGFFYGPVYPTIMAIGGNIYPHRLAALSGSLTTAGATGVIVYPPLMGLLAGHIGLKNGMIGAGLLGIPCALAVLAARRLAPAAPDAA